MTTVGFIGSGMIGGTVARLAVNAGYQAVLSNSRGPQTLADLAAELGRQARAATCAEAAAAGDLLVVAIATHQPRPTRPASRCMSSNTLIADIERNDNDGIGKPEPLKHGFQGYRSRRISDEHRLVYKIAGDEIRIAACRYHYER